MIANATREVLARHAARYPLAQAQDMVKLLYQSEFAGGHLILNEAVSLQRLREECKALEDGPAGEPAWEDIGGGLARLHLRAARAAGLSLDTLNRFFVLTSNANRGTAQGLQEKLAVLQASCAAGELPFSSTELDAYLERYAAAGFPPERHSAQYRAAYFPAYRVVQEDYARYLDLFARIDGLLEKKGQALVAIDGNSGAGKSSLGSLIAGVYDANLFHMDDYFLPAELRTPERLAETGGNVDYARFKEEVIAGLRAGGEFQVRPFDCRTMALQEAATVQPKRLNIVEGVYCLHPTLRDAYDLKVFLGLDAAEQSRRILERNGPRMHQRFINEWIPMENRYFEGMEIRELCDLVYG